MHYSIIIPFISLLTIAAATPTARASDATCYSGVYMIVARETNAKEGEGRINKVATAIQEAIPDSTSAPVDYPANKDPYDASEHAGVMEMKRMIRSYVRDCGDKSNIVLLGYSQGAQVVSDTLGGSCLNGNDPLRDDFAQYIKGAVLMGDPSRITNQSYDTGTATNDGHFKRTDDQLNQLMSYAPLMQSYCDAGDEWCDSGPTIGPHLEYVQRYGTAATDFIVNLITGV